MFHTAHFSICPAGGLGHSPLREPLKVRWGDRLLAARRTC